MFTNSHLLGVIACPGAEEFSSQVIKGLRTIYKKRYEKLLASMSRRYDMSREETVRRINFVNELNTAKFRPNGRVERYRVPDYQIPVKFTRFANGEVKAEVQTSLRGMDIYIFSDMENHYPLALHDGDEPRSLSINDHLMLLFTTIDAVRSAGINSINLVLPTYPYARQHKKKGREALTAAWFGQVCEDMGVERIVTLDIHSRAIENSFGALDLENLHASYQIIRELKKLIDINSEDMVVVSPDTGAVDRNKFFAGAMKKPLALLYKERDYSQISTSAASSNITSINLLGDVQGKTVFMADDMLGTGGTLIRAMRFLKEMGAERIICAISLPLFSGSAVEHFEEAYGEGLFHTIIGTNAVYHREEVLERPWYVQANIVDLFAQAVSRLQHKRSLSSLLDNSEIIQKLLDPDESTAP